jgi:hypothetical protein
MFQKTLYFTTIKFWYDALVIYKYLHLHYTEIEIHNIGNTCTRKIV